MYTITEPTPKHFKLSNVAHVYATPALAKADCWRRFGVVAIRLYDNEALFDASDPKHAALARIESRYSNTNTVVAVGTQWYLIRRSKFGVEAKVNYTERDGEVHARNRYEPIVREE